MLAHDLLYIQLQRKYNKDFMAHQIPIFIKNLNNSFPIIRELILKINVYILTTIYLKIHL